MFHYFHPYRYLYDDDWDGVLRETLPKVAHAENSRAYHLAVAGMVAHVRDTHCFVSSAELSSFYGIAPAGVEVRWIEGRARPSRAWWMRHCKRRSSPAIC